MATLVRRDKGGRMQVRTPLIYGNFLSKTTAGQRAPPERNATSLALVGAVAPTAFDEWTRVDKPLTCQLRHKSAGFSLQVGMN
ncbi:hypothetical protein [Rhodanobacter panaciterrae]|uniref:hypothetical protein n=1 Tax=Rhodanobacter panaciterrae TaxID=490572 RepID=UPI00167C3C84|nr:hypothetical protein [Rhodanobacter panaciterrae]